MAGAIGSAQPPARHTTPAPLPAAQGKALSEAGLVFGKNGMSQDAALAAITINPARVFGVGARLGSLEAGKDADLVLWSGDPFEPLSRPLLVLIRGEAQPLTSRQFELRDRYKDLNRPYPPAYTH